MPRLWIANSTTQNHHFCYRPRVAPSGVKNVDGSLRPTHGEIRKFDIPLGGQACIGDLDQEAIDEILKQRPDVVPFKDLHKPRGFQGFCYKVGADPVPVGELLARIEENDKIRTAENVQRLAETGKIIATNMRDVSQFSDTPFKDLRETDVQVAQKGATEVNGGTPKLNNVVEVVEAGKEPSTRGRRAAG